MYPLKFANLLASVIIGVLFYRTLEQSERAAGEEPGYSDDFEYPKTDGSKLIH